MTSASSTEKSQKINTDNTHDRSKHHASHVPPFHIYLSSAGAEKIVENPSAPLRVLINRSKEELTDFGGETTVGGTTVEIDRGELLGDMFRDG